MRLIWTFKRFLGVSLIDTCVPTLSYGAPSSHLSFSLLQNINNRATLKVWDQRFYGLVHTALKSDLFPVHIVVSSRRSSSAIQWLAVSNSVTSEEHSSGGDWPKLPCFSPQLLRASPCLGLEGVGPCLSRYCDAMSRWYPITRTGVYVFKSHM